MALQEIKKVLDKALHGQRFEGERGEVAVRDRGGNLTYLGGQPVDGVQVSFESSNGFGLERIRLQISAEAASKIAGEDGMVFDLSMIGDRVRSSVNQQ